MPMPGWLSVANHPGQGGGTAYASSNTAADVSPAPQFFSQTWGPLFVGQRWRYTGYAIASNTSTPTLNLGVYYGGVAGTALATTGAITTTTAMSGWWWKIEVVSEVISLGSSGTIRSFGWVYIPTGATATTVQQMSATAQDVTVNTGSNSALTMGATWGTSNASNTLTCKGWLVEQN